MSPPRRNPLRRHVLRRIRARTWLRLAALIALVTAGVVLVRTTSFGDLFTEERLLALIAEMREIWWAPLAVIALYTFGAPLGLPMGPLLPAGAAFGPMWGSVVNTVGLVLGAATSYLAARALGRDFVAQVAGDRLRRTEHAFDRHGFWPLVHTRFLPLPFPVVNFGAALAGIRPGLFLGASVAGLIPSTLIHSVFIALLFEARGSTRYALGAGYAGSILFFNVLIGYPWIRDWIRRRRAATAPVNPSDPSPDQST